MESNFGNEVEVSSVPFPTIHGVDGAVLLTPELPEVIVHVLTKLSPWPSTGHLQAVA